MSKGTIFLSHIHEEHELAQLIKTAVENEFSGFIDVFVSSDGVSIPAGANFLKRIDDALCRCIGAVYLISPTSVKRNWISFELGAVWIRNALDTRAGKPEIPAIPMCHSGIMPATLPTPLNNLNAISANQSSQLESAFQSLQATAGGKGPLRTNFDTLAASVTALEHKYTLGSSLRAALLLVAPDVTPVIAHCVQQRPGTRTTIHCGFLETATVQRLKQMEASQLAGHISVSVSSPGIAFGDHGGVNGAQVDITMDVDLVTRFRDTLLQKP